jgi:HK97 family phage major capsid protein
MNVQKLDKATIRETAMVLKGEIEGINASGGVFVPELVANEIIVRRNRAGVARRVSRVIPMGSDAVYVPRRLTDVVANYVGAEGQAITETDVTYDNVGLVAVKLAALHRRSSELAEDEMETESLDLLDGLGYAFAKQEDASFFVGGGGSANGGIKGLSPLLTDGNHAGSIYTATGHSTWASLTSADYAGLMALLPDFAYNDRTCWILNGLGFGQSMAALGATAGLNVGPDGSLRRNLMFLGFPVELTSQLPGSGSISGKLSILFGDASLNSTIGSRRQLTIRRLDERYADADQIGYVATQRWCAVHHDIPSSATSAGPVVALVMG